MNTRLVVRTEAPRLGAMLILLAILMIAFLATVALSVDVAYMQLVRTELRTATDATARAAVESLGRTQDLAQARKAGRDAAQMNLVAGKAFDFDDPDLEFGSTELQTDGRFGFTPGLEPFNAARLRGERTSGSVGGAVSLFFGKTLGTSTFQPVETSVAAQMDRDICLVLDRSGSMAWKLTSDTYPSGRNECTLAHATASRWGQLEIAVNVFLQEVQATLAKERLSLVTFSSNYRACRINVPQSEIEVPLTDDYSRIASEINLRSTTMPIIGGTAIGAGIDDGTRVLTDRVLSRRYALKTMIVLTDGVHNNGRSPLSAAQDAAGEKIVIHTITYSSGADQAAMKAVAAAAGGKHFHAPDAAALRAIFKEIALTLPVMLTE